MSRYVVSRQVAQTTGGSAADTSEVDLYTTPATWRVCEDNDGWPLVADRQFILATRDTGYRSIAAAVSELVDNAIQAHASSVHLFVREEGGPATREIRTPERRVSLAVLDNGAGMDARALRTALQFGGSGRFNDRSGAGRFGMGLPNSSVSQSRRLEVYSWRDGNRPLYTYLDVEEIACGTMREVPLPIARHLPDWASAALESAGAGVPLCGTLVVWPECDRLPYRKASTIRSKLIEALGQTYRYPLRAGTQLFVDGKRIEAIDPLMERGRFVDGFGAATPYGDELHYEFKVPKAPQRTSVVRVRFTMLPVRRWARLPVEVRRKLGIMGGAGVSVVRAGREVDYGWHLLGAKRRENYDDWWRCEVCFDPELDEYFGITHSKQGISPHPALKDAVAPDMEQIARTLNARIRREFVGLATTGGIPGHHDQQEPTEGARDPQSDATRVACARERFLPPIEQRIRRFRIEYAPLASPRFFVASLQGKDVVLTVNCEHPFYITNTRSSATRNPRQLLDLLLLAAARAELVTRAADFATGGQLVGAFTTTNTLDQFLDAWSDAIAAYLSGRA